MSQARGWEPRYTRSDLTLANFFTGARIVMIPIFGWLWATGRGEPALWVFLIAVVTDLVDGFLARWLNQRSRLGALLDPIADKLLMLVSLIVGIYLGAVPVWFAAVIIARELVIAFGVFLGATRYRERHGPQEWRPTRLGKYSMFLQSVTIALVIVDSTLRPLWLRGYARAAMALTALLTLVSGAQYTVRASRAVWGKT